MRTPSDLQADDLENLVADALGGVQAALEGERRTSAPGAPSQEWAKEAVRELKQGDRPDGSAAEGGAPGEDFFCNLVKTFQDEHFQKAMAEALQGKDSGSGAAPAANADFRPAAQLADAPAAASAAEPAGAAPLALAAGGGGSSSAGGSSGDATAPGAEDFLQNFLKSFDQAVGDDGGFEKSLTSLMTSMLSNDLICEPLQQITEKLEPWLKSQKGLAQTERARYEAQLRIYRQILNVYRQSPDPLPEPAREEVQRLLTELHHFGQPPDEVMQQIAPKEAEDGGESFEDFMKSMGLDSNLGSAEQDLLKKLSEDPEELTRVMKDMAGGLPDEACKQQ